VKCQSSSPPCPRPKCSFNGNNKQQAKKKSKKINKQINKIMELKKEKKKTPENLIEKSQHI